MRWRREPGSTRLRVSLAGGPLPPNAFGYSAHTGNTVFWIATETLGGVKLIEPGLEGVYAARLAR
jgi:hypothetical protein